MVESTGGGWGADTHICILEIFYVFFFFHFWSLFLYGLVLLDCYGVTSKHKYLHFLFCALVGWELE